MKSQPKTCPSAVSWLWVWSTWLALDSPNSRWITSPAHIRNSGGQTWYNCITHSLSIGATLAFCWCLCICVPAHAEICRERQPWELPYDHPLQRVGKIRDPTGGGGASSCHSLCLLHWHMRYVIGKCSWGVNYRGWSSACNAEILYLYLSELL